MPYEERMMLVHATTAKELRSLGLNVADDDIPYCEVKYANTSVNIGNGKKKNFSCIYAIFNIEYPNDYISLGDIAHEAAHVASLTLSRVGWMHDIQDDLPKEEPYTYLVGYLTNVMANFLLEQGWQPMTADYPTPDWRKYPGTLKIEEPEDINNSK